MIRSHPLSPQEAQRELRQYSLIITVDARLPVANFGYSGGPSLLLPTEHLDHSRIWEFDFDPHRAENWPGGIPRLRGGVSSNTEGSETAGCHISTPTLMGVIPWGSAWASDVLRLLALELKATAEVVKPNINCGGAFCPAARPQNIPQGKWSTWTIHNPTILEGVGHNPKL